MEANAFCLHLAHRECWLGEESVVELGEELQQQIELELRDRTWLVVDSIVEELDETWAHSEQISGILAVRLGVTAQAYCVWFRPEYWHTIEWVGDPRRPVAVEERRIFPRRSFEEWNQVVAERSRHWSDFDRATARNMARVLKELSLEVQSHQLQTINEKPETLNRGKEELLEEIEKVARTDDLTGLNNRRGLMEEVEHEFERPRRYDEPLSLLLLDLDHFKHVNDAYGHRADDEVLRVLGELLIEETRTSDVAGRYGGEEFAVLLPHTSRDEATELASRILEALRSRVFGDDGEQFRVTCSIGVAERLEGDESEERMLTRADEALYRAKEAGRNTVEGQPEET
jgi:diguanylate cyclase (GGDEF)-like protein